MGEYNIAPNTQIGKIIIDEKVYANENAYNIEAEKYSRGGEFIENMVTDNCIEFCHRWFHLANFEEFIKDMDEYFEHVSIGKYSNLVFAGFGNNSDNSKGFAQSPIIPTSSPVQEPIIFNHNRKVEQSPIIFFNNRDENINYQNLYAEKKEKEKRK